MKSRRENQDRKNLEPKVQLAIAKETVAAGTRSFECHEDAGYQVRVMVYHVMDQHGGHQFLPNNKFDVIDLGGTEAFEKGPERQFHAFDTIGTVLASRSKEDPRGIKILDSDDVYWRR
jgi:hypothetical protein